MPSTDLDGTPILILRLEDVKELAHILSFYDSEGQLGGRAATLQYKVDRFLAEVDGQP